jgi:ABC-type multidrug transport system permease subunit
MSKRFTDRSIAQLTLVRFKEFIRQPEAVFWTFVFPILLAIGLGLAFRSRAPDQARVAVVARPDASGPASKVLASLRADSALVPQSLDDSSAARALRTGKIALIIVPTSDTSVDYRFDPERSESRNARMLADIALQKGAGREDPMKVADRIVTEKGSRYIDFVIPGLLGMNLMGSGIWGIGFAIVDARSKGLLKRFMATPMSRAEYLLAFLLSRLVFLVLEVVALVGFGALAFGVPTRGSILELSFICLASALMFSALGLLVAARAKTIEGVSGLMNLVMLPQWIFSGVFFSSGNFPDIVQPVIKALPLTAVNDALRANMLEGTALGGLSLEMAIVVGWLAVCFVTAMKLFRWR